MNIGCDWCNKFAYNLVIAAFENHASITYAACREHTPAAAASAKHRRYQGKGPLEVQVQQVMVTDVLPE